MHANDVSGAVVLRRGVVLPKPAVREGVGLPGGVLDYRRASEGIISRSVNWIRRGNLLSIARDGIRDPQNWNEPRRHLKALADKWDSGRVPNRKYGPSSSISTLITVSNAGS